MEMTIERMRALRQAYRQDLDRIRCRIVDMERVANMGVLPWWQKSQLNALYDAEWNLECWIADLSSDLFAATGSDL